MEKKWTKIMVGHKMGTKKEEGGGGWGKGNKRILGPFPRSPSTNLAALPRRMRGTTSTVRSRRVCEQGLTSRPWSARSTARGILPLFQSWRPQRSTTPPARASTRGLPCHAAIRAADAPERAHDFGALSPGRPRRRRRRLERRGLGSQLGERGRGPPAGARRIAGTAC